MRINGQNWHPKPALPVFCRMRLAIRLSQAPNRPKVGNSNELVYAIFVSYN